MKINKIDVAICTKNRHFEVTKLLSYLRIQTILKRCKMEVFILDDGGTPQSIEQSWSVNVITNQLRNEGIPVYIYRNDISKGISTARQMLNEIILKDGNGDVIVRIDDDTLPELDYIERLVNVIEMGYDLSSGMTPNMGYPYLVRANKFMKPFINDIELDKEGNIIKFGDDCGYVTETPEIIPACHLRSSFMYTREVAQNVKYVLGLSQIGFREESFFCLKAILKGYKMAVDTGAVIVHERSPMGGCRAPNYNEIIQVDDTIFREWVKEMYRQKGDFILEYRNRILKNVIK